jgi:hypothetical protein
VWFKRTWRIFLWGSCRELNGLRCTITSYSSVNQHESRNSDNSKSQRKPIQFTVNYYQIPRIRRADRTRTPSRNNGVGRGNGRVPTNSETEQEEHWQNDDLLSSTCSSVSSRPTYSIRRDHPTPLHPTDVTIRLCLGVFRDGQTWDRSKWRGGARKAVRVPDFLPLRKIGIIAPINFSYVNVASNFESAPPALIIIHQSRLLQRNKIVNALQCSNQLLYTYLDFFYRVQLCNSKRMWFIRISQLDKQTMRRSFSSQLNPRLIMFRVEIFGVKEKKLRFLLAITNRLLPRVIHHREWSRGRQISLWSVEMKTSDDNWSGKIRQKEIKIFADG